MQDTRQRLRGLQKLAHKTRQAERNILESAKSRLSRVAADLAELKPRVLTSQDAAQRYQDLIVERGKLHHVIIRAQQVLGE